MGDGLLRQHPVVDIVSQEGLDRLQMPCKKGQKSPNENMNISH